MLQSALLRLALPSLNYSKMQKPQRNNNLLLFVNYTLCLMFTKNTYSLEELVHVYAVPHSIFEAQMTDLLTAG